MWLKTALMTVIMFCCSIASQGMIIHNYCEDIEDGKLIEEGNYDEDYLFLGNELNFKGNSEDLLFFGKKLEFGGSTKLGIISFGKTINVSGTAGNGVIAGGKKIQITGIITGNNFIGAKSITIDGNSKVNGNLFTACDIMAVSGVVNGDIYAAGRELLINNEIKGDVKFYGKKIVFGENGKISGNLTYAARNRVTKKDSEKVSGIITYDNRFRDDSGIWGHCGRKTRAAEFFFGIAMFISTLVISSLILFLPVFKRLDLKRDSKSFWKTLGWGVIPVFAYPVLVILSVVILITIPLAVLLIFAGLPLFFIAYIIGATLIGNYLIHLFSWRVEKRHYQFYIGALALFIVSLIPIVNCLSMLLAVSLGWGIYLSFLFNKEIA